MMSAKFSDLLTPLSPLVCKFGGFFDPPLCRRHIWKPTYLADSHMYSIAWGIWLLTWVSCFRLFRYQLALSNRPPWSAVIGIAFATFSTNAANKMNNFWPWMYRLNLLPVVHLGVQVLDAHVPRLHADCVLVTRSPALALVGDWSR